MAKEKADSDAARAKHEKDLKKEKEDAKKREDELSARVAKEKADSDAA
jgi:hypothetical protein